VKPLYNARPSRYAIAPRTNSRALLCYENEAGRFFPVVALTAPLAPGTDPFARLSMVPLPHLKPR
jgi:hypothetical protein